MSKYDIHPCFTAHGQTTIKVGEKILNPDDFPPEVLAVLPIYQQCHRILMQHILYEEKNV